MYVSKIEIANFRNFKETEIEFSPHMNVIIGHNNSGKTNLIKALQLILAPRCFKWVKLDLLTAKMIVGYAL
jgi:predicted ATP-dependent endonuclease of OLD family